MIDASNRLGRLRADHEAASRCGNAPAIESDRKWSGELLWRDAKPGDKTVLEIPFEQPLKYRLDAVFTKARDYAKLQVQLKGSPLVNSSACPGGAKSAVPRWGCARWRSVSAHSLTD